MFVIFSQFLNIRTSLWSFIMLVNQKPQTSQSVSSFLTHSQDLLVNTFGHQVRAMSSSEIGARLLLASIDVKLTDPFWYRNLDLSQINGVGRLVVISCHTGYISHTGRSLLIAQQLRALGAKVVFIADTNTLPNEFGKATQRKYSILLKESNFPVYHVDSLSESVIQEFAQQHVSWGCFDILSIRSEMNAQLDAFEKISHDFKQKADIILTDFSPVMTIHRK